MSIGRREIRADGRRAVAFCRAPCYNDGVKFLRLFKKRAAELLFPTDMTCELCGVETFGGNLCPDCRKTLTMNDGACCPVCGRQTARPELCMECKAHAPQYRKAVSPLVYEGGAVALIYKFKHGNAYLKDYFADLICRKLAQIPTPDAVVCVPLTKKAERRRGYNQSGLLAAGIAERLSLPYLKNVTEKIRDTTEQKGLARREREKNLSGCFRVRERKKIKGKTLLLVDDVMTTGATADEVCRKLRGAGAKRVYVATVCSVTDKSRKTEKEAPNATDGRGDRGAQ